MEFTSRSRSPSRAEICSGIKVRRERPMAVAAALIIDTTFKSPQCQFKISATCTEPAVEAVTRGTLWKILAVLHVLEVLAHILRLPRSVAGEIGDV